MSRHGSPHTNDESRMPMQMDTKDDEKMENEKNMCPNPQLVEVEKKEERMIETIQTNNQDITKHYKTGFVLMLILS